MQGYTSLEETMTVPLNTGVEGFLLAMRKILRLPKVQEVHIDLAGRVRVTRLIRDDEEPQAWEVDFSSLTPMQILRHQIIVELEGGDNPTLAIARLFQRASQEHMVPIAFAAGAPSSFWRWQEKAAGLAIPFDQSEAYGLPVFYDANIDQSVLILCTAHTRGGNMIDVKKGFQIRVPEVFRHTAQPTIEPPTPDPEEKAKD